MLVRPPQGIVLKHLTARDMVLRCDTIEIHIRAAARSPARFLDALERRMPLAIRAIQVGGRSQFQAEFERQCQRHGIRLFVLRPRSQKLSGCIGRAQMTHAEEFYGVSEVPSTAPEL